MKVSRLVCIFTILFAISQNEIQAQENSAWEREFFLNDARAKINKKEYELAISILGELEFFHPDDAEIILEKSISYFQLQRFEEACFTLKPLIQTGKGKAIHYQLYGNSLDALGNSVAADSAYINGLLKFPDAGELYMELGITALSNGDSARACGWWERGMEMAPAFASNYYWAALTYSQGQFMIRSLLYGEIFLNLESHSDRTEEISDSLFSWYARPLPALQGEQISLFESEFQRAWNFESPGKENLSISMLHKARMLALINWVKTNPNWHHPFWDRMEKLQSVGLFDAYDHWLFANARSGEAIDWRNKYPDLYAGFGYWFMKNPLIFKKGKHSIPALFYN